MDARRRFQWRETTLARLDVDVVKFDVNGFCVAKSVYLVMAHEIGGFIDIRREYTRSDRKMSPPTASTEAWIV